MIEIQFGKNQKRYDHRNGDSKNDLPVYYGIEFHCIHKDNLKYFPC